MTVGGRATVVNVFPRVICYIPDLPQARLVYGRLLYCLPCCNFLADTEEGEPRTLHGDYFVGVGGVAPPSVVNRLPASTKCGPAPPRLRAHLHGDDRASVQATLLPGDYLVRALLVTALHEHVAEQWRGTHLASSGHPATVCCACPPLCLYSLPWTTQPTRTCSPRRPQRPPCTTPTGCIVYVGGWVRWVVALRTSW